MNLTNPDSEGELHQKISTEESAINPTFLRQRGFVNKHTLAHTHINEEVKTRM